MLLCAFFLLSGCAVTRLFCSEEAAADTTESLAQTETKQNSKQASNAASYEWAMQAFEAGDYQRALANLESFEKSAGAASFLERTQFYRAVALSKLGRSAEAEALFKDYLSRYANGLHAEESRLRLLELLSMRRVWEDVVVLAAEIKNSSARPGYQIFALALWTEALLEKSEWAGAASTLAEAKKLVTQIPQGSLVGNAVGETKEELDSRLQWLESKLNLGACRAQLAPPKSAQKALPPLQKWFRQRAQCTQKASLNALVNLPQLRPRWNLATQATLAEAWDELALIPASLVSSGHISQQALAAEAAHPELRQAFYAIAHQLNMRTDSHSPLNLAAKIETLLHRISLESATSDRAL